VFFARTNDQTANSETFRYWTKMAILSDVQRDGSQKRKRRHTILSQAERLTARASSLTRMVSAIIFFTPLGRTVLTLGAGDVIAKLTDGDVGKCAGKEIDEDGDVYNAKNQVIGHVTLLEDIPPEPEAEPEPEPEPTETPEEIEERKQLEQDKKLAGQLAMCVQQSLDKINPVLKMITDVCRTYSICFN
jgi:Protein of unknown function (DUF3659)/Domain of unknown function (DUF6987)